MPTHSTKQKEVVRKWYVLDASEAPLGRLSTVSAKLLIGKGKPDFSYHLDGGDYVVIINSEKLVTTGNKTDNKIYYRHSGYPGGLRQKTLKQLIDNGKTAQVIEHAIRGMLPDNKLRKPRLARLKIYPDANHAHQGQAPEALALKDKGQNG